MADIAHQLAADFLRAQGWCCIRIAPVAAASIVTIGGIGARGKAGSRVWLPRKQQAEKIIEALLKQRRDAKRRPQAGRVLLVKADVNTVRETVETVAFTLGLPVVDDDSIEGQIALFSERIRAAMSLMKRDGTIKRLHCEYRAARASGATLPKYDDWFAARMRPVIDRKVLVNCSRSESDPLVGRAQRLARGKKGALSASPR
jgi:hypothetical protein